jgi:hypothetical protein
MKVFRTLFFLVLAFPGLQAASIGLLPEERQTLEVAPTEKNPFGVKVDRVSKLPRSADNEEARIRLVMERLPVGGVVEGERGRKVMLGPLILEEGQFVQQIVPNQREMLRVLSISDERIEIGFVESSGSTSVRKITIPIDLTPEVKFRLGFRSIFPGSKNTGFDGSDGKNGTKKSE